MDDSNEPWHALVKENMGLAWQLIFKWQRKVPDRFRDDVESAALYGLTMAALNFDPTMEWRFSTYAYKTIRGYILHAIDRDRPKGYRRRSDYKVDPGEGPAMTSLDHMKESGVQAVTFDSGHTAVDFEDELAATLAFASEAERSIATEMLTRADCRSSLDQARMRGVSRQYIDAVRNRLRHIARNSPGWVQERRENLIEISEQSKAHEYTVGSIGVSCKIH